MGDKGGKGLVGETAIFQLKVEHWDGSREHQFESILSAHSALCAMLQDKLLHGDRYTCHFFYVHSTVNVFACSETTVPLFDASRHILPYLPFIPAAVKLAIPYLTTLLSFCVSLENTR